MISLSVMIDGCASKKIELRVFSLVSSPLTVHNTVSETAIRRLESFHETEFTVTD